MRRLALAALLLLPVAAGAQELRLRPPDLGAALHELDHLPRLERDPDGGLHQTYVVPERPGQNQIAWYDFDWHHVDVPAPDGGPGGLRLYYYLSATPQARRALPAIESAYARLVSEFAYSPTKRIPYILYATQREFQTQNVFLVSESVLGVTSLKDLKMTVPYFGDHSRFVEVSTHEMVHQFTIQKMLDAGGGDELASPMLRMPLWFVEGIAEYYSKGGLDVETEGFLRDLIWNPDAKKHYEVVDFANDKARGYIPTYKLGQARIAFIAETYGRDKIQSFLENAYLLGDGSRSAGGAERGFGALVRRVLSEPVEQVDARWRAWLKRRFFAEYTAIQQDLPSVRELRGLPDEPEAFAATPDGTAILVRGIDRERGRAHLYLADLGNPKGALEVVGDDQPGVESLHPIDYGILALADGLLAFSAQDGNGDTLYTQGWRRRRPEEGQLPQVELGRRRKLELRPPGGGTFVKVADPAISADLSQVAFVGTGPDGQQDIYVAPIAGGTARRLTDDFFAERELAWGPDGLYYASDATDHGRSNLFRIDPATGARTRLTTAPTEDHWPRPQADGTVLFASNAGGKTDLWLLEQGSARRITDFTTGLRWPAVSPKARGILAITFHGGVFRLVEVPRVAWLAGPRLDVPPSAGEPLPIPQADLPTAPEHYESTALRNWRPEAGIIYGGGDGSAVAGRAAVLFADYLRDQVLFVDVAVYGSWELTQGQILYENRTHRTTWALGAFQFVQQQFDRLDPTLDYLQRDFGVVGALRFPRDRFQRLEAELTLGAVDRFCLTDGGVQAQQAYLATGLLPNTCSGFNGGSGAGLYADDADWRRRNLGVSPLVGPVLRYGYDSVRFDQYTGPLAGSSVLLELGGGWLPTRGATHGWGRAELAQWWQLAGRANLMVRLAGATSFSPSNRGRTWERSWWLSSADNLRGYSPFDVGYLIGQGYYVANAELQVPLEPVVKLLIFDYLEGVAALDFGGVFNRFRTRDLGNGLVDLGAWESRTLTGVVGINALLGPLLLRLHWGHPFDVGGVKTPAMQNGDRWVTNLTLRYFFF